MKCSDRKYETKIVDYVFGGLSADEQDEFVKHRQICASCAAIAEELQRLASQLPRLIRDELAEHLPSDDLVEYAERPSDIEEETRHRIEFHLLVCDECRRELALLQEVNASLEKPKNRRVTWWRSPTTFTSQSLSAFRWILARPAPLYRIAAVGAVAVMVSVFLFTLFQTMTEVHTARISMPLSSEKVTVLSEQTRGQGGGVSIGRIAAQDNIRLLVQGYWPEFDKYSYQVAIEDTRGAVLIDSSDFKGFGPGGITQFVVPSQPLADGKYFLRITRIDHADSTSTLSGYYPFELTTVLKR